MPSGQVNQEIFISAVSDEFRGHREHLRSKLAPLDGIVRVQPEFANFHSSSLEKLYHYIFSCDLVIHLVGASAGRAPTKNELERFFASHPKFEIWLDESELRPTSDELNLVTYTQWESYFALFLGKKLYCFYSKAQEAGATVDRAQNLHCDRVKKYGQDGGEFTTQHSLATEVLLSLQSFTGQLFAGQALLTERDFIRDTEHELPNMASVGRRPSIALLRDQQYMPRLHQLSELDAALKEAADVFSNDEYCDLPVFWISGASGSGKSVLLLQFMQQLVDEGRRVLWIDDNVELLQSVLDDTLDRNVYGDGVYPEFIFVDDLYAPRHQHILRLADLQRTINSNPDIIWPTVITCGPGQYYDAFRRDVAAEGFVCRKWTLPKVSKEEAPEVELFFSKRSMHPVSLESQVGSEGGLFISMAMELRHGNLEAYAKRFAERLKDLDLLESLKPIIALNRLYIAAPRDWLTDHERDRLETLNEDMEFLLDGTTQGREYIRLTHPHLSNEIYAAICSPGNPRIYGSDIIAVFNSALKTDVSTAITLLKAFGNEVERLQPVDMHHVTAGLSKILDQYFLKTGPWDLRQKAEFATALAVWDAKSPELGVSDSFGWDVRSHASEVIATLEANSAPFWMSLIRANEAELSEVEIDRIVSYLDSDSGHSDPSWHLLYGVLLDLSTNVGRKWRHGITRLGVTRIEQDLHCSGNGSILVAVINAIKRIEDDALSERVSNLILEWLAAIPAHHRVPNVVKARYAIADDNEIEKYITTSFQWFDKNGRHASIWGPYFKWFTNWLSQKEDFRLSKFLEVALELLEIPEYDRVAPYILEVATRQLHHFQTDETSKLRVFALKQLENTSHQAWSFFLEYLEELGDLSVEDKEKTIDLGLIWLDANRRSSQMGFVWNALFRISNGLESKKRQALIEYCEKSLNVERPTRAAVTLASNLMIHGLKLIDHETEQLEKTLNMCAETILNAPPSSEVRFLIDVFMARDQDKDRSNRIVQYLASACSAHKEALRRPNSNSELTYSSVHYHTAASLACRHIDLDDIPISAPGYIALKEYLDAALNETLENYTIGSQVNGSLTALIGGGLFIMLPTGINGYLPKSSIPTEKLKHYENLTFGDTVDVWLNSIDEAKRSVYFTAYSPEEDCQRNSDAAAFIASLKLGQKINARVSGTAHYGVFFSLAHGITGLLHRSELNGVSIKEFEKGTDVEVWIKSLDEEVRRIKFTNLDPEVEYLQEQEVEAFARSLVVGQTLDGVVKSIEDYGAFITLEQTLDGLLHVTDITWFRVKHPGEILSVGQAVTVQVIKIVVETRQISLSMKHLQPDPYESAGAKFLLGSVHQGSVINIADYGVFVEMAPGVVGLVHISELYWDKKNVHPNKVASIGQKIDVVVLEIDATKRQMQLSMKQAMRNPWEVFAETHPISSVIEGEIKNITDFGLFIGLDDHVDGMVHISDISGNKRGEKAIQSYHKGDKVRAMITEVDIDKARISLSIKALDETHPRLQQRPISSVLPPFMTQLLRNWLTRFK